MAKLPLVLLLPPSEGKAGGGDASKPWSSTSGTHGKALATQRQKVANAFAKHHERVIGSATLPAFERYTGVVWKFMDLNSLTPAKRRDALKKIHVVSGLVGLVRADDPIPNYKLKMSARIEPLGNLTSFWRPALTEQVSQLAAKHLIIDLLPNEHRAAIAWEQIPNHVRVDLVAKDGGRVGGHNAKAAKGLLARHLLTSSLDAKDAVRAFRHPEYKAKLTLGGER